MKKAKFKYLAFNLGEVVQIMDIINSYIINICYIYLIRRLLM
jgi:hypothetical protein